MQHPSSQSREDRVNEALAEFLAAEEAGQTLDVDAFLARNPDVADDLKSFLANRDGFRRFADDGLPGSTPQADHSTTDRPSPADTATWNESSIAKDLSGLVPAGYEVLGELGRGGMGVVYRVRDLALNREVALKMVLGGRHASDAELMRFLGEARAAAAIQHVNVVQVYTVDASEGLPYFTLELCAGGSLAAKLAGSPLPPEEAARLIATLARAIQHAHETGIVHRDLKPANVLLASPQSAAGGSPSGSFRLPDNGASWTPKIADFGLAKHFAEGTGFTATGAVMGTPCYMAPEQAIDGAKAAGPLADVYSLGAILYECLTGRPPFCGATALEVFDQVRTREPVAPRLLQPAVPRDLETIVLKTLQKDSAKRYPSAAALADDLERFVDRRPITARPVGRVERTVRLARRHPTIAGLVAAVVLVAFAGLAGILFALADALKARSNAETQEDIAKTQKLVAENRAIELDKALGELSVAEGKAKDSAKVASTARDVAAEALARATVREAWREMRDGNWSRSDELFTRVRPESRRWEWYYLKHQQEAIDAFLPTPADPLGVRFSPDNRSLVAACGDSGLLIWNAKTGDFERTLRGPEGGVTLAMFSPDGRRLAVSGDRGEVWIWNATTLATDDAPACVLRGTGKVTWLAFTSDGERLAVAHTGRNPEVKVWNLRTESVAFTLDGQLSPAFSPDGARLSTVTQRISAKRSLETILTIWDANNGHKQIECPESVTRWNSVPEPASRLAFAPDGRTVSVVNGAAAEVYDATTGRRVAGATQSGVAIGRPTRPDLLLKSELSWTWNAASAAELAARQWPVDSLPTASVSPDGQRVAHAVAGGVAVRDLRGDRPIVVAATPMAKGPRQISAVPRAVACGRDARIAVARGRSIELWDGRTGERIAILDSHTGDVAALAFSPDGEVLASGGRDGTARLWDWSGALLHTFVCNGPQVTHVHFSADGSRLTTASKSIFATWDLATRALISRRECGGGTSSRLAVSPDGARLASVTSSSVRVWDLESGQPAGAPLVHSQPVYGLAFSRNSLLATCGNDLTARIWDAATFEPKQILRPGGSAVHAVAFSPDGQRLVTAQSNSLKLWDSGSGEEVLSLTPPGVGLQPVGALTFSPDGDRIVAATDNLVVVWHAPRRFRQIALRPNSWAVRQTLLNRDGTRLAIKSWAPELMAMLWTLPEAQPLLSLKNATGMAFSPDGTLFATGVGETVTVYEARDGKPLHQLPGHIGGVGGSGIAFSPDGRSLATGAGNAIARVWDVQTGAEVLKISTGHVGKNSLPGTPSLSGYGAGVAAVAFSPDAKLLATGGADGSVKLWNAANGELRRLEPGPVARKVEPHPYVLTLEFDPDGSTLEAMSAGSLMRRTWDVPAGRLLPPESRSPSRRLENSAAAGAPIRAFGGSNGIRVLDLSPPTADERARLRLAARFDAGWHRSEVARHEGNGRPEAAVWHLDLLLVHSPEDSSLARRRRTALTRAADATRPASVAAAARACLHVGDETDYRTWRATILDAFARSPDRETTVAAASVCALAPGDEKSLKQLADAAMSLAMKSGIRDDLCSAGLLLWRVGRGADAEKCLRMAAELGPSDFVQELGLALAAHSQSRTAEARKLFDRATIAMDRDRFLLLAPDLVGRLALAPHGIVLPEILPDPLAKRLGWSQWRELQILRKEVEGILLLPRRE